MVEKCGGRQSKSDNLRSEPFGLKNGSTAAYGLFYCGDTISDKEVKAGKPGQYAGFFFFKNEIRLKKSP